MIIEKKEKQLLLVSWIDSSSTWMHKWDNLKPMKNLSIIIFFFFCLLDKSIVGIIKSSHACFLWVLILFLNKYFWFFLKILILQIWNKAGLQSHASVLPSFINAVFSFVRAVLNFLESLQIMMLFPYNDHW